MAASRPISDMPEEFRERVRAHRRVKAYIFGYSEGVAADTPDVETTPEPEDALARAWDAYTDGTEWSDVVAPELRRRAGFHDKGGNRVYTIRRGDAEETLGSVLLPAFKAGFMDAAAGRPSKVVECADVLDDGTHSLDPEEFAPRAY